MKEMTSHYLVSEYKDAKKNQEMVKLLVTCTVMANLHFSVNFQRIIYIFFLVIPPSTLQCLISSSTGSDLNVCV